MKENNVLTIVFRDNLHQPQYVEKLDKLVRFCIKEKVLSLQDLDRIWAAQDGKHEIIVKNIHDLLVKLAWDFSPDQLEHLFGCFQVRKYVKSMGFIHIILGIRIRSEGLMQAMQHGVDIPKRNNCIPKRDIHTNSFRDAMRN